MLEIIPSSQTCHSQISIRGWGRCDISLVNIAGKSSTALALAKEYDIALLTVDNIVTEAIANGNTPAGMRARERCLEESREMLRQEGEEPGDKKTAGGLSLEAVAAHTQGTGIGSCWFLFLLQCLVYLLLICRFYSLKRGNELNRMQEKS